MKRRNGWRMSSARSKTLPSLLQRHILFSNPSVVSPTSPINLQHFRRVTYVTAHSPTLPSLHLCRSSLQSFRRFTYVTAHSPSLPSLHLRHISFSNPFVASPTSQPTLQPFRHFTYVTAHSSTLPSLHLCHSFIFCRFIYITVHSPTLLLLHLHHSSTSNPSFASPTSPGEPPMPFKLTHNFLHCYFHKRSLCKIHGLGHKSWLLFYFVDICEWITNVYVSCGMSAGIVSTHVVNTLSFRLYKSHFPTGLVSSK